MWEVPDVYLTRQARALVEALQEGDLDRAAQIENHLLSEAAEDSDDREVLREELRCALLFRALTDATEAGDELMVGMLTETIRVTCSPEAIRKAIMNALLVVGLKSGGLPSDEYDQVVTWAAGDGVADSTREMVATLRRLE